MSRTYDLCCVDCKQGIWVGQGWPPDKVYIYTTKEALAKLQDFLFTHQNHHLEFGDDELMDNRHEYERIDSDD